MNAVDALPLDVKRLQAHTERALAAKEAECARLRKILDSQTLVIPDECSEVAQLRSERDLYLSERDSNMELAKKYAILMGKWEARALVAEAKVHALRLVCGTTDANKFETALDRAQTEARRLREALTETVAAINTLLPIAEGETWAWTQKRIDEYIAEAIQLRDIGKAALSATVAAGKVEKT